MDSRQLGLLCGFIVVSFIASSISGIMRGIKWLSYINMVLVLALGIFFGMLVDLKELLSDLPVAFRSYTVILGQLAEQTVVMDLSTWFRDWPVFYWSSWIAWAPITGMFLARLTYGYTIRQLVVLLFVVPSTLTMTWLAITTRMTLHINQSSGDALHKLLGESGPGAILDGLLSRLPFSGITALFVLASALICFITTADSNLTVMAELNVRKEVVLTPVKIFFGVSIGALAWTMVTVFGVDGLRILNNLAALPAIGVMAAVVIAFFVTFSARKKINYAPPIVLQDSPEFPKGFQAEPTPALPISH